MHCEIDAVAENASNTRAALSNDLGALSNNLVELEGDLNALSNTLAYNYITTRNLNDQLVSIYVQKYEKLNFSFKNIEITANVKSSLYPNTKL